MKKIVFLIIFVKLFASQVSYEDEIKFDKKIFSKNVIECFGNGDFIYDEDKKYFKQRLKEAKDLVKNGAYAIIIDENLVKIKKTKLELKKVFNDMVEKKLYTTYMKNDKDINAIFLPLKNPLKVGQYKNIFTKQELYPNEKKSINFNGSLYVFYATGDELNIANPNINRSDRVQNYRLYVSKGTKTQLLSIKKHFDDAFVEILFVGDLDKDGELDMIINDTGKYSITNIIIYLSSKAKKDELMGAFSSYGGVSC